MWHLGAFLIFWEYSGVYGHSTTMVAFWPKVVNKMKGFFFKMTQNNLRLACVRKGIWCKNLCQITVQTTI